MATSVEQLSVPSSVADERPVGGVFVSLAGRLVYPEDDHVLRFLREGWFEHRELVLMSRLLRPGDIFIDAGAHCGLYSSLAARRLGGTGTIVVVEPNPALHPYICQNIPIGQFVQDGPVKPGMNNLVSAAVAAASGTALLHIPDSGSSAYSSLHVNEAHSQGSEIEVLTRSLESLVPVAAADEAVFMKLDIEGMEHDILQSSSDFLRSRDNLHLLIEFDEQSQSAGRHATAELGALLEKLDYELAEFDPVTGLLKPFVGEYPLWGRNLLATKQRDLLNGRLGKVSPEVLAETQDFLERGAAAYRLYRRSESLTTMVNAIEGFAGQVAETFSVITADPGSLKKAKARRQASLKSLDPDQPIGVVKLIEEELGRIKGSAQALAEDINRLRIDATANTAEREALAGEIDKLRAEAATIEAERETLTGKIDALAAEAAANAAEREVFGKKVGKLRADVIAAVAERKALTKEVDRQRVQITENAAEKEALTGEIDKLHAEGMAKTQALASKIDKLRAEAAANASEREALAGEIERLRAEATADAAKREALAGEIDKLLAEAASNADERKALSDQTDELSRELQMERSRLEHIEGEFTRLREPVDKARGQIANLIAGVHSEKSAAARSRGLFRRPAHSSHLDEVLTAADAAKTALSSAALQIQSLAKEANLDRPWEQGHQTVITQDSGLNARIQDLNARIYQMGMLATDLRRSHWLKFGDRLGVGASNRADAIIAIFDKWKQQSDPHDPDETPDS